MFFRRLRLAIKYAGLINVLMGVGTRSDVRTCLLLRPELLADDALSAAQMMIDNARVKGDLQRVAGLTVILRLLTDAREHGVEAAIAAIAPMGPLLFQYDLLDIDGLPLNPDEQDDTYEIGRQLIQSESPANSEALATVAEQIERLPPDLREMLDAFTRNLVEYQHTGQDAIRERMLSAARSFVGDPRVRAEFPDLYVSTCSDMAGMLIQRFERAGTTRDLDEALELALAATALPDPSPDYAAALTNLGVIRRYRAAVDGDGAELDKAIGYLEAAILLPNVSRPIVMHNLGLALQDRYVRTGDLHALEQSVKLHLEALDIVAPGSPLLPLLHNAHAIGLTLRNTRIGDPDDLDNAVRAYRAALDLTPPGRPHRPMILDGLANALRRRAERAGSLDDVTTASELLEEARTLLPHDGFRARFVSSNLGHVMRMMYSRTGESLWLDRAVDMFVHATADQAPGDLQRPSAQADLAMALAMRYERAHDPADEEGARHAFRQAVAADKVGEDVSVLGPARWWLEWALRRREWAEATEAGAAALTAAYRLHRTQVTRAHKENWLHDLQGLPAKIGYARVRIGDLVGATVALERGSAVLLSETLQRDRAELDRLEAKNGVELARRFRDAVAALEEIARQARPLPSMATGPDPDRIECHVRRL